MKGNKPHYAVVVLFFLGYSLENFKKCVQAGFKVGANIYGVYASLGVQGGKCEGLLNEMGGGFSCFMNHFCSLQTMQHME